MKKGANLAWFFCGVAFMYFIVVLGFIFDILKININ